MNTMLEHDYEPAPGLPESLPREEHLLWQGGSDARSLALGTFHIRKLAAYFAALLGLRLALQLMDGVAFADALSGVALLALLAAVSLGLMSVYASLVARSTMFTITNRRIVIRCGVAVPMTVNLPFSRIDAVSVRERGDGSGEIALLPESRSRVSYVLLWPMVKPWRWFRVQPVLRGIPEVASVAAIVAEAISEGARHAQAEVRENSPAEDAAATDASRPAERPGPRDWLKYPTLPLAAASSLVVIALVSVAWIRISGGGADTGLAPVTEPVIAAIDLRFEDRDDGSVVVIDAADGRVIDQLQPGTNGFIRGTLRSFARERRTRDSGPEEPFSLQRTDTGRLLLSDASTGRSIDLRAFGPTNAEAFGRFLSLRPDTASLPLTNADAGSEPPAVAANN